MVTRNRSVMADMFGVAFEDMLRDIEKGIDQSLAPAVRAGCKTSKQVTTTTAISRWPGSDYPVGFNYQTEKTGMYCEGEMGNSMKPGLVHLLEKGHAIMGGGRSRAFTHVEEGYEAGVSVFEDTLNAGVKRAL